MREWPAAPRPWIDLSTGINPWPYPAPRATGAERRRLPDPEAVAALEAAAAKAFGIGDPARVLATPGAEAAIRLLTGLVPAEAIWIKRPTYGGHAAAWIAAGRGLVDDPSAAGVQVVVNPNNPDGSAEPPEALLARADGLARRDGWLVVDESFIEATDAASMAPLDHPRVLVLRSFGKVYGLAGLRLGFLIGEAGAIGRARLLQGEWAVSVDAIAAGRAAYADPSWLGRTRPRLARAARRLDSLLQRSHFALAGGTPLFRLAAAEDARDRFAALGAQGILTRPFAHQPHWLRFGLPPAWAWPRLVAALESLV
jgi:cobalamin biosynthetic protein CobC